MFEYMRSEDAVVGLLEKGKPAKVQSEVDVKPLEIGRVSMLEQAR